MTHFDTATIEGLLRMATRRELPPLDTIEVIEAPCARRRVEEMPGPLSITRMASSH